MNLEFETQGDVLIARVLDGRFDAGGAEDFKQRLAEQVAAGRRRLVLDLSHVTFMDSGALGAVLGVLKSVPPPGDLRLAGVTNSVRTVFRLTRLDKVLSLHDDVAAAVASFGASG